MPVRVQQEDFDAGVEIDRLRRAAAHVGAIAAFIGTVRDQNLVSGEYASVTGITLEHYPGMTESALEEVRVQAHERWDLIDTLIVHRYGELKPQDQIVLVVATSSHRADAFAACEFMMDYLKTRAPFWKKETTSEGSRWVVALASDDESAARWEKPN